MSEAPRPLPTWAAVAVTVAVAAVILAVIVFAAIGVNAAFG